MRFLYQSSIVIVLSVIIGVALAYGLAFSQTSGTKAPFSECRDYPLNAAPATCQPLVPILIVLAIGLLILVVFQLVKQTRKRG